MSALLSRRCLDSTLVSRVRAEMLRRASNGVALRASLPADELECLPRGAGGVEHAPDRFDQGVRQPNATHPEATILRFPGDASASGPNHSVAGRPRREADAGSARKQWAQFPRLPIPRSLLWKAVAGVTMAASATAGLLPPLLAITTTSRVTDQLAPRVASRTAIWILDRENQPLGVLPQDGESPHEAGIRSRQVNSDFARALRILETGSDYFGISPRHLVAAAACATWRTVWGGAQAAQESCPGGSTLLMQVSTQLRGGKANRDAMERKWTEIRDAMPLSVSLPPGYSSEDQLIADQLPFGTAGGRTIIGLETAAQILFGRSAGELSLAQSALLAAMPKRQVALFCAQPSSRTMALMHSRWSRIRQRAQYALMRAFAGDARLGAALAEVRAMPDRFNPAPLPPALTLGMTPDLSCAAAMDPVRRTDLVDASMRSIVAREIASLPRPDGLPITDIQLATAIADQRAFKTQIEGALRVVESSQRGRWLRPLLPQAGGADVLAFTVDEGGALTGYYASNARGLGQERRRLGSQSKLAALLAFAAAGRDWRSVLCNHSWNGLHNANGDPGFSNCSDPRAQMTVETAFARSSNLPLLHELRQIDPAIVARAARNAGFTDLGEDLPYAIAFGVAESTPLQVAAMEAAISRGVSGEPAMARIPRAIVRYRVDGRWLQPPSQWVDLRPYFTSERARRLFAAAGGAPLGRADGTLHRIIANDLLPGEVAKSGTDQRDDGLTYAKAAVGARRGRSWFAMVAADRGPVSRSGVNVYALAGAVRRHSLQ